MVSVYVPYNLVRAIIREHFHHSRLLKVRHPLFKFYWRVVDDIITITMMSSCALEYLAIVVFRGGWTMVVLCGNGGGGGGGGGGGC